MRPTATRSVPVERRIASDMSPENLNSSREDEWMMVDDEIAELEEKGAVVISILVPANVNVN